MIITERISSSGATRDEICHLERRLNAVLPRDYRAFLEDTNGGRPSPRQFEGPDGSGSVVDFFFTADPQAEFYWIGDEIEGYTDRIPDKLLPIATDPFGNIVLLDLGAKAVGASYFWEHEKENFEGDPWWDNNSYIAPSFADFVNRLH